MNSAETAKNILTNFLLELYPELVKKDPTGKEEESNRKIETK